MAVMPVALADLGRELAGMDRTERMETLVDYADRFVEVPASVATRPFDERNRAPRCESEAYVWAVDLPDGGLALHFAVENPQGLSAKAWAVILTETVSGAAPEQLVAIDPEIIYSIFGRDLSMGKGQGLLGMLELVQFEARKRLEARRSGAGRAAS
jgi:cysteine desulfuration protein SufE